MPSHRSTPGSSAQRRSPHCARARAARWCSRSGLIRVSTRRHRRRRCVPSSVVEVPLQGGDHGGRDLRRGRARAPRRPPRPGRRPTDPAPSPRATRPARSRWRYRPVRRRPAAPRSAPAAARAPPRRPAPPTRSPARPTPHAPTPGGDSTTVPSSSHSGSIAANRAIAASCTARRHVDHPLQPNRAPPPTPPATRPPPRSRRHPRARPAPTHTPPAPRPDPWPSPSPPAVSLPQTYRRPPTDPRSPKPIRWPSSRIPVAPQPVSLSPERTAPARRMLTAPTRPERSQPRPGGPHRARANPPDRR